jgi:hypothetical protein
MNRLPCYIRWGLLLTAVLLAAGCPAKRDPSTAPQDAEEKEGDPPHGGIKFAEPGHKYHAELIQDETGKQVLVYLLNKTLKAPVSTTAKTITLALHNGKPTLIALSADRQDGDPKDAASRFKGEHDCFGQKLDAAKIEISAEIDGKPYILKEDKH